MLYGGSDDILSQYVNFTKVYDQQRALHGRSEQAIRETLRICKRKHYLKEYLQTKEKEIYSIMYTLFDEERITRIHERALYDEGKADAEKAFAEREAAYAKERAAYQSRIAELEARLAMQG